MTKVTHNLGIKVTCIFLVMITGMTAFFSIVGILFAGESGIFSDQKKSYYDTPWCENTTYSYSDNVVRWYIDGAEPEEIASIFSNGKTNFAFELYDYNGNLVIKSELPEKIGLTTSYSFYYHEARDVNDQYIYFDNPVAYTVVGYVADPLSAPDNYWLSYRLYNLTMSLGYWLFLIALVSLFILAASFIYLLCAAGHRGESEEIILNVQDRIPLDIYLLLWFGITSLTMGIVSGGAYYGDLDVSVIDELPPGRKPVQTLHRFDNRRASLYAFIRGQLQEGRQAYIVYPLIQESEKMDIKNLEDGYVHVCEAFPEYKVSKVHGKMKPAEKDAEMQRFLANETQILVATTVIEVGVNVPNASVMVIENAERFGLSQLHQLRGRVGRGADQSYCILVTGYKLSEETRKRIEIMVQTNDGFEIAEADLKLRGPGDLEGTQQSGVAFDLKIANIARDGQLLQYVREIADRLLDADPNGTSPTNAIVWKQLQELRKKQVNWSVIS